MTPRHSVACALLVTLVLWSATAFADGGWQGRHGMGGGLDGRTLRTVGLTDAQKEQIRQIRENHRPQMRALGEQVRTVQRQIGDQLYGATAPTPGSLAPLTQQIDQLRSQMAQARLQMALEIRNVLTPEQLAKAAQTRQQLQQLREQRRNLLKPAE